jgi:hypothetical protein
MADNTGCLTSEKNRSEEDEEDEEEEEEEEEEEATAAAARGYLVALTIHSQTIEHGWPIE